MSKHSTVEEIQKETFELFKVFKHFCEERDIVFFLYEGTLLGAVRHQGFIPWDDDLDVAMDRENFQKFLKAKDELPAPLSFEDAYTVKGNPVPKVRDKSRKIIDKTGGVGVFVDIFCLDYFSRPSITIRKWGNTCVALRWYRKTLKKKSPLLYRIYSIGVWIPYSFYVVSRWFYRVLPVRKDGKYLGMNAELPTKEFYEKEDFFPLKKMRFETEDCWVPNKVDKILTIKYGDWKTPVKWEESHF